MKPRYVLATLSFALSVTADDGARLLRLDHYVQVRSGVPAIGGQNTQIYVREGVEAATVLRGGPAQDRVALFIHGAGTPAEVACGFRGSAIFVPRSARSPISRYRDQ